MSLKELGEFGLIERIDGLFKAPLGVMGIGDDCSVMPQSSGLDTLVSTDMLIEGSHFLLSDVKPKDLGWKSAAVNFSDVAGMGGSLQGSWLSLGLPKDLEAEWMLSFMEGYKEISDLFHCPLLGGDTTTSLGPLCINVGVMGVCEHGKAKLRSDARVGDLVCVTGMLGDAAAGLHVILSGMERGSQEDYLVSRHYRPMPQIQKGLCLAKSDGVHAMMDISDGVASDLRHILKASGVGASIDTSRIPMSEALRDLALKSGKDPLRWSLSGGEDYELLFTADPAALKDLEVEHYVIGEILEGSDVKWSGSDNDYLGFRHF